MFARGIELAPLGSIEDRMMREMVFRERQERVANVEAIGKMIARVVGYESEKLFGGIIGEYAAEVFQETYDQDLLNRRIAARRSAQASIRAKRQQEENTMRRLDRMGEYADTVWAKEKQKKTK